MAMIDEVIAKHYRPHDDLSLVVSDLDFGLYNIGISVMTIRDMLVHGALGGPSQCNPEEVAASAEALLSYVGRLGVLIDRLEAGTNPYRQAAPTEARV